MPSTISGASPALVVRPSWDADGPPIRITGGPYRGLPHFHAIMPQSMGVGAATSDRPVKHTKTIPTGVVIMPASPSSVVRKMDFV